MPCHRRSICCACHNIPLAWIFIPNPFDDNASARSALQDVVPAGVTQVERQQLVQAVRDSIAVAPPLVRHNRRAQHLRPRAHQHLPRMECFGAWALRRRPAGNALKPWYLPDSTVAAGDQRSAGQHGGRE